MSDMTASDIEADRAELNGIIEQMRAIDDAYAGKRLPRRKWREWDALIQRADQLNARLDAANDKEPA